MTRDGGRKTEDGGRTTKDEGRRTNDERRVHPRSVILQTLGQRGPLTLDELARAIHRSPLATRYHLGMLKAEGLVTASAVPPRARVGRPQTLYTLTPRAHTYLPHQYDWLAQQLLDELARACGERELRAAFRRIGRRLADTAPLPYPTARLHTRVTRAVNFLCSRGYAARAEHSNEGWVLTVHHCPYQQVAHTTRAVCELDLALLDALIQVPFRMTRCIARQDTECVFVLQTVATKK
ncbi:MAG: hypothetical protein N2559_10425 [Anaerolineae bacterium]|nr:hypothetical protein [Anaerolineae bacterium]